MEINKESFNDILWNKYDNIQKQFDENQIYFQTLIKYFKEVLIEIDRHIINLSNIKGDSQIKKFTKLNDIFHLFNLCINFNLENHKKFINNTITNLEKYISKLKQLVPVYSDFKQYFEFYTLQKKNFNKIKEKFHESALLVEKKTLKKVKKKNENQTNNPVEISNKLKKEVNDNLKKYQTSIEKTNQKRVEFISKQKNLIKLYVEMEEFNINIYYTILNDFLSLEKDKTIVFLNNSKFKKLQAQLQEKDLEKEIKEYFNEIKSDVKNDEKKAILFEGFKSNIDIDKCTKNEDINAYAEAVDIIDKNFKEIFDGITLEKEKSKNNIREWIKKFFDLDEKNIDVDQDTIEEYYYTALKHPYTHKSFLKIITDLRATTHFNRNKQLIDLLGNSFKILLLEAKPNKDYWIAKNCLILSQTFYYLDNNNKIYSSEFFKNDSWMTEKNFWIEFCSYMVNEELKKLVTSFPELTFDDIQQNKTFNEKLSSKIDNVIFSQLFTLFNNIIYFTNDNLLIIEIMEIIKEKYIYLSEKNIQVLYQVISSDKNIIKNLIDEYNKSKQNKIKNNSKNCNTEDNCIEENKDNNQNIEDIG